MPELSVLIPARNEIFLRDTIENVLANIQGDTEIVSVLDGYWPDPPILDHPRVVLIHHTDPIGQRAATNEAARVARGQYLMKLDAHCAVDNGFDVKLIEAGNALGKEVTQIPRMYNLHAFDWQCAKCGHRTYQGPTPTHCENCKQDAKHDRVMVWQPRLSRKTDFARFDNTLHFQYWQRYKDRPEAQGDIVDVMCSVGACFFMHRDRFLEIGGLDERHGSWGQYGVEIACKSVLSGGRHVVNKNTWFAHMFRTQGGDFSFPYPNPGVEVARGHSRWLWNDSNWEKAVYPLSWLLEKYWPVPDWTDEDLRAQKAREQERQA